MDQDPKMQGTDKTAKKLSPRQKPAAKPSASHSSQTANPDLPPKKDHTNLVIGLIILVIFILFGGAFLAWYCLVYNNPSKITADAMQQFLSARQITTSGTAQTRVTSGEDEYRAVVSVYSQANQADNHTTVSLQASLDGSEFGGVDDFELELGLIKLTNGAVYLQIANVIDSFDQYLASNDADVDDLDDFSQLIYNVVEVVDGEWWEISLPDILEALGLDDDTIKPIDNAYNCVMQASAQDYSQEFIKAYQDSPFIKIAKSTSTKLKFDGFDELVARRGNKYYKVSLDHEQLANFLNVVFDGEASQALEACYRDYQKATGQASDDTTDGSPVTADDLNKFLPEDLQIYLEITGWTHQLYSVVLYTDYGAISTSASFQFDYQAPAITAPESYRPVTDFAEELERTLQQFSNRNGYYGDGIYYINDNSWD